MKHAKVITFVGLPRGGQHAIMYWMLDQVEKPRCLVKQKTRYKNVVRAGSLDVDNNLVISAYEGHTLEYVYDHTSNKEYLPAEKSLHVICIRDFFNWIASLSKRMETLAPVRLRSDSFSEKMIQKWKSYAKEFLNETNIFSDKISINYNQWFVSREYRQVLSSKFGSKYSESTLERVASPSRGSSFDNLKYQGKASQMLVEHRWVQMANDSIYRSIVDKFMEDEESCSIFLSIYGKTEAFRYFSGK